MKKIITFFFLVSMISFAEENNITIDKVSNVVSEMVSTGKDVMIGIKKGIDEGYQKGNKIEGAYIIENAKDLKNSVDIKILQVNYQPVDKTYEVVVGFKNKTDKLIRITGLNNPQNFYGLDKDDYTVIPEGTIADVTIFKNSQVKQRYIFKNDEIKSIKIYELKY